MRVLIGYDGSETADAGLEDLKRAGLPDQTEALVVTAGEMWMPATDAGNLPAAAMASRRIAATMAQVQNQAEQTLKEAEETSNKAVEQIRSSFPNWRVETEIISGDAASALIQKAADWEGDLIIIGTQDRGALARFFLGSVSRKIFTGANCSVRVARAAESAHADAPRIIIGVDGSPAAEQAIHSVGRRVWQPGTEVRLIAVNDRIAPPGRISTFLPQATQLINSYNQSKEMRVRSMIDWGTSELNVIGLKTTGFIKEGDAQTVLIEEARKWNADSIFVGTRDFDSSFERFRLGSVSTAVATQAHCSVEVVRS